MACLKDAKTRFWNLKKRLPCLGALCLLLYDPAHSLAWNPAGHRVIGSIAYRQLDDTTKRKLAEILRNHPAYRELWVSRPNNASDEARSLLWNASLFPDDARRAPWDKFNRPKSHYINYRILGENGNKVLPPLPDENVVDSYNEHLRLIRDPATSLEDRALHLSWILHQAGDIHQPLHAVARFSKALPEGDRGGNEEHLPNPRAITERGNNLHAYWDDLLGADENPAAVERLADELTQEHPAARFDAELTRTQIREWAEESVQIALTTVYNHLDAATTQFASAPPGYDAEAQKAARLRVALAGYRLANELKRLMAEER
jgi:hypothetical protein